MNKEIRGDGKKERKERNALISNNGNDNCATSIIQPVEFRFDYSLKFTSLAVCRRAFRRSISMQRLRYTRYRIVWKLSSILRQYIYFTSRCVTRVRWTIMKSGLQTEEKQWPTYERSISKFAQLWDVHFAKLAPMDNGIYADDPCARENITEAGCNVWPVCNFRETSRAHAK